MGAVGLTYLAHARQDDVRLTLRQDCQPRLGEAVLDLEESDALALLARRVFRGVSRHVAHGCDRARHGSCGCCEGACADRLLYACALGSAETPQAVLEYVRLCFEVGPAIAQMTSHPVVCRVDALARRVANECEHTRQFVRFSQCADGSLFARFSPNADTLPLVAGYFDARMGSERFCLLDPTHRVACLHAPGSPSQVVRLDGPTAAALERAFSPSDEELAVRELWRTFYQRVSLDFRSSEERGYDLRAKWMPKRFWAGLPELG